MATRDDLVLLMGDTGLGPPPDTVLTAGTWQQAIDTWARAILAVYRAHPWAFDVPLSGPPAMPNQLAWLDALLQGLQRTGLTDQEQLATNGEFDGDGQDNGEAGIDDVLDFSLERLIDGIAALVATRTKPLRRR